MSKKTPHYTIGEGRLNFEYLNRRAARSRTRDAVQFLKHVLVPTHQTDVALQADSDNAQIAAVFGNDITVVNDTVETRSNDIVIQILKYMQARVVITTSGSGLIFALFAKPMAYLYEISDNRGSLLGSQIAHTSYLKHQILKKYKGEFTTKQLSDIQSVGRKIATTGFQTFK